MVNKKAPRIICFDLESLPNLQEVAKIFPGLSAYPGLTLKATINSIICFGYKTLNEKKTYCINVWDTKHKHINDDRELVKKAYEILKDADVVVTHNGKRFDWKFLQTRLLSHGLPPLPKIIHIDTCQEAKKNLLAFNNRLDTLAKLFKEKEKLSTGGWQLWVDVLNNNKKAMSRMTKYCIQDVKLLERIFLKLRPFLTAMPKHNMFSDNPACCLTCGSANVIKEGTKVTKTTKRQRYKCLSCYSWFSV